MDARPNRQDAQAALGEIDSARRAVAAENDRALPVVLAAWSILVAIDYTAKDLVPERAAQRWVSALCAVATIGIGLLENRSRQVQPISVDPDDVGARAVVPMLASMAVWGVAERLVVRGLRASRLRRPNTVAGAILAVTRPAGYVVVERLTPRPGAARSGR